MHPAPQILNAKTWELTDWEKHQYIAWAKCSDCIAKGTQGIAHLVSES